MTWRISLPSLISIFLNALMILCASFLAFGNVYTVSSIIALTILNIIQIFIVISYCFAGGKLKERFAFFTFNVAYFTLLQASYILNIGNQSYYGRHAINPSISLTYENETKGLFYILLAQFVVFVAYTFRPHQPMRNSHSLDVLAKNEYMRKAAAWSRFFMVFGGFFAFFQLISKIVFVAKHGYIATYLEADDALYRNPFIDLFDRFYTLGFYGYLATFPDRKKIRLPITVYVIYSGLTLLTGIRGAVVINTLFIIWYYSKRDQMLANQRTILSKPRIALIGLSILLALPFLYRFAYYRTDSAIAGTPGFFEMIRLFFQQQGGSGKLVALGLQYKASMLPYISPFMMIFAPVRNFVMTNSLVRIFTSGMFGQSLDTLRRFGSFQSVLLYVVNPSAYLGGFGLGSSFVAELAVAGGVIGVVLGSFILGRAFFRIDHINMSKWGMNVFLMNAFIVLTYTPRSSFLGIIPSSAFMLIYLIIVHLLAKTSSIALKPQQPFQV